MKMTLSISALIKILSLALMALIVSGCAHSINISPDLSTIGNVSPAKKIDKNIGFFFAEDREKEVTTSGGGGDLVKYRPYKDVEVGFSKIFGSVFASVRSLRSSGDPAKNGLDYTSEITVSTNSSSPGLFTWPPTVFGVNITNSIRDSKGVVVANLQTSGQGNAELGEMKGEFGLAGKRATQDALIKMQQLIVSTPALNTGRSTQAAESQQQSQSIEDRLRELKRLFDGGLMNEQVYRERQKVILGN